MRKLLLSSLVLISLHAFGQDDAPQTPPPMPTFFVTIEMGTDTLKNGIDTVRLSEDALSEMNEAAADTNFSVIFTPRGDCGQLNLMKTTFKYFIVKEQGNSSPRAIFNYIITVKQNRPMMPPRPPMPKGTPPQQ